MDQGPATSRVRDRLPPWLAPAAVLLALGSSLLAIRVTAGVFGRAWRVARFAGRAARLELHKRCPDCAERVRGEARVCKHCGYRFAPAR
jgi:hypothetical protein